TFNVGQNFNRPVTFQRWLARHQVDVVCFQEIRVESRLLQRLKAEGWSVSRRGRLATRLPVVEELAEFPYEWDGRMYTSDLDRFRVRLPSGTEAVVASAHLPTIRVGLEGLFKRGDVAGLTRHQTWWAKELARVVATVLDTPD